MHFDTIIRGGTVVSSAGQRRADVGILGEQILAVDNLAEATAGKVIDATGLHILPGAIDTQVHFREPGLEHKEDIESGTRSAICGGVTTIFEMPNTNPATITAEALQDKLNRASGRASCDYAFFVGAATSNLDELFELEMMPGTPGVKMFAGSSTGDLLVELEEHQRKVMQHGKRPMPVHSEDEARLRERKELFGDHPHVREHWQIRDAEAARISTERMIRLSAETGGAVHILHISTLEELPLLAEAKANGINITCEVTPHHLTLNSDAYETLGTLVQMNPPVRSEEHRLAIWQAVKDGLFDVFGSDHAPHTLFEKANPYPKSPSGMPGVQTLLPIMLNWVNQGQIPIETVVKMLMERPAELYGIERKGSIKPGFDADIAMVDMNKQWTILNSWIQSKCGWTPYHGKSIQGSVEHVLLRGNHVVNGGEYQDQRIGKVVEFSWK